MSPGYLCPQQAHSQGRENRITMFQQIKPTRADNGTVDKEKHTHRALVALFFVEKLVTNPITPVRIEMTPNMLNIAL